MNTMPVSSQPPVSRRLRTISPRVVRFFAWAAVITNGLISVTGAAVRVTGSGLGCSTWPQCHPGTLVPQYRDDLATIHQVIEFGNRTITGVVLAASLGTFFLIWMMRPHRPQLLWLAAIGPIGVIAQAIVGGVVVLTGLQWWTVAPHLLLSLILVFAAVAVVIRLPEEDGPATLVVPRPLALLSWVTAGVLLIVCVTGTLVTAAGPHAGDINTPRLGIAVIDIAQVHADLMHLYFGLMIALTVGFFAVKAPKFLRHRALALLGVTAFQGIIGLVQYRLGVPEVLVLLHIFGAVCLTIAAAYVALGTRRRMPSAG